LRLTAIQWQERPVIKVNYDNVIIAHGIIHRLSGLRLKVISAAWNKKYSKQEGEESGKINRSIYRFSLLKKNKKSWKSQKA